MSTQLIGDNTLTEQFRELIAATDGPATDFDTVVIAALAPAAIRDALRTAEQGEGEPLILCATLVASATEIASWSEMPERVVGFAALPPLGQLIELMPASQSSERALHQAETFWRSLDLEPVRVADSVAGVTPRVLCNLVNEAAHALAEGVASPEDIDRAMQLGTNWPRGPLAWGDLIGIETVVAVLEALGREHGAQYEPAPLLLEMAQSAERFHRE